MINVPNLLDPLGVLGRMHHVTRYSGYPAIMKENVAEHSWLTSMYSYLIARDAQVHGIKINMELLLSRCIIHDLDESLSGDVIRSFKYATENLKDEMNKAAKIVFIPALETIFYRQDTVSANEKANSDELVETTKELWESCGSLDDVENFILKFSDFLTVLFFSLRDVKLGNNLLKNVVKEVLGYICELVTKLGKSQGATLDRQKHKDMSKLEILFKKYLIQISQLVHSMDLTSLVPASLQGIHLDFINE